MHLFGKFGIGLKVEGMSNNIIYLSRDENGVGEIGTLIVENFKFSITFIKLFNLIEVN